MQPIEGSEGQSKIASQSKYGVVLMVWGKCQKCLNWMVHHYLLKSWWNAYSSKPTYDKMISHVHGPALINRQVPHIAAVRANGELKGMANMCVTCIVHIQQPNGPCNFLIFCVYITMNGLFYKYCCPKYRPSNLCCLGLGLNHHSPFILWSLGHSAETWRRTGLNVPQDEQSIYCFAYLIVPPIWGTLTSWL